MHTHRTRKHPRKERSRVSSNVMDARGGGWLSYLPEATQCLNGSRGFADRLIATLKVTGWGLGLLAHRLWTLHIHALSHVVLVFKF